MRFVCVLELGIASATSLQATREVRVNARKFKPKFIDETGEKKLLVTNANASCENHNR